ncbi:MAG TPA: glycosyltransferase, partial [Bacillales bacterium]|nr:glycosyltransferase [Bacillales bacterium]
NRMPERNLYLSGLRYYAGFKQTGIPIERNFRYSGKPRVSIAKLFKLASDGIFSFSIVPLQLATYLGLFSSTIAILLGLIGLYFKLVLGSSFLNWSYGLTTTFFIGGIQLLCLGILGEYIGRIYEEVKQRPIYIIDKKINFEISKKDV